MARSRRRRRALAYGKFGFEEQRVVAVDETAHQHDIGAQQRLHGGQRAERCHLLLLALAQRVEPGHLAGLVRIARRAAYQQHQAVAFDRHRFGYQILEVGRGQGACKGVACLLQGAPRFFGPILGGCIDTLYDLFNSDRYADSAALCQKYMLFPTPDDWHGRILLLESSEEQPPPHKYRRMLAALRETGVFSAVAGILVGKPMDEKYAAEYQSLLLEAVGDPSLPILYNVNVGHATPRCILPFGVPAQVDAAAQRITFAPA